MPKPIPPHILKIIKPKIPTRGEWIRRTRRARDLLIERHGYRPEHFVEIEPGDNPTLGMFHLYQPSWAVRGFRNNKPLDWVEERRIPAGLILHWPEGFDCTGEAHDPHDPVMLLAEAEHYASLAEEEWKEMTTDDISGAAG